MEKKGCWISRAKLVGHGLIQQHGLWGIEGFPVGVAVLEVSCSSDSHDHGSERKGRNTCYRTLTLYILVILIAVHSSKYICEIKNIASNKLFILE